MAARFGVVDLFAGPGGLGEGFASVSDRGVHPYQIEVSIEKEESAHRTLRLRSFVREFVRKNGSLPSQFIDFHSDPKSEPDWSDIDRKSWDHARCEALCLELGRTEVTEQIESAIRRVRRSFDDAVLIGGPPCQAYSLVGRARSRGKVDYVPEKDERHFLFREYIRVLDRLRPAVFVMENVKGMLSSSVDSRLVFEMLMEDLSS